MKKNTIIPLLTGLVAGVIGVMSAQFAANAEVQVQVPSNVVGTGSNAWHYLIMEGESYVSEQDADPATGFGKVYANEALTDFYGTPILATNTLASKRGALGTLSGGQWGDKVTYQVVFDTPGTYYTYMRFSMFENGGNTAHYINEDSFFMPPDFNKDPQFDWPITNSPSGRTGGYVEGCCGTSGFLYILDYQGNGSRTQHTTDTNYWEGNFHWNQLISSQFLNPADTGDPNVPFRYEVTPAMVGIPQNFTIGFREIGVTIDLFLFSTHTNMMNDYTQTQLDQLVNKVTVQDPGNVVGTGSNAWSYLVMESESFINKSNNNSALGFTGVAAGSTNIDFYGTPILATNTLASKKGALYTLAGGQWGDKVTYQVQFARTGAYYMYMRFTMFENGGNTAHYINEDSFFMPPDFNKDPQYEWPIPQPTPSGRSGGYVEGCCGTSGFLYILDYQGNGSRTQHTTDTNYWEGAFHWNQLISSQFLNPADTGDPNVPFHYEVTPAMLGVPQNFTIGFREIGVTPDLFLFSTHTNMMNDYTQAQLDQLILPKLTITATGANALISWPTDTGFVLEATSTLSPASWSPVLASATVVGTRNNLTVPVAGTRFYRLRQP